MVAFTFNRKIIQTAISTKASVLQTIIYVWLMAFIREIFDQYSMAQLGSEKFIYCERMIESTLSMFFNNTLNVIPS